MLLVSTNKLRWKVIKTPSWNLEKIWNSNMKKKALMLKDQWKSSAVKSKEEIPFNWPAGCIMPFHLLSCDTFLKLTHCFFLVWEISCLCWPASFLISSKNSSLHFSLTCLHFLSISPCALATALFTACLFSSSISVRSCQRQSAKQVKGQLLEWKMFYLNFYFLNCYYWCRWRLPN